MVLHNTSDGYGTLTKSLHWLVVALFAFQFAAANIMLRLDENATAMGMGQSTYYNWHKSIGLVALVVAVLRLLARRRGRLPDWAPTLSERERAFIHRAEQVLYAAMFVMPVSGFIYVMAGGYGVNLFGVWELPNPISARPALAAGAKWTHIVSATYWLPRWRATWAWCCGTRWCYATDCYGGCSHAAAAESITPQSFPRIETSLPSR
jgi:cytochrome b561